MGLGRRGEDEDELKRRGAIGDNTRVVATHFSTTAARCMRIGCGRFCRMG